MAGEATNRLGLRGDPALRTPQDSLGLAAGTATPTAQQAAGTTQVTPPAEPSFLQRLGAGFRANPLEALGTTLTETARGLRGQPSFVLQQRQVEVQRQALAVRQANLQRSIISDYVTQLDNVSSLEQARTLRGNFAQSFAQFGITPDMLKVLEEDPNQTRAALAASLNLNPSVLPRTPGTLRTFISNPQSQLAAQQVSDQVSLSDSIGHVSDLLGNEEILSRMLLAGVDPTQLSLEDILPALGLPKYMESSLRANEEQVANQFGLQSSEILGEVAKANALLGMQEVRARMLAGVAEEFENANFHTFFDRRTRAFHNIDVNSATAVEQLDALETASPGNIVPFGQTQLTSLAEVAGGGEQEELVPLTTQSVFGLNDTTLTRQRAREEHGIEVPNKDVLEAWEERRGGAERAARLSINIIDLLFDETGRPRGDVIGVPGQTARLVNEARAIVNGLVDYKRKIFADQDQELEFFRGAKKEENKVDSQALLDPEGYNDVWEAPEYQQLFRSSAVPQAQIKSALINLAFARALANDSSGRLSDTDLRLSLQIIGTSGDPVVMASVLQTVVDDVSATFVEDTRRKFNQAPQLSIEEQARTDFESREQRLPRGPGVVHRPNDDGTTSQTEPTGLDTQIESLTQETLAAEFPKLEAAITATADTAERRRLGLALQQQLQKILEEQNRQ